MSWKHSSDVYLEKVGWNKKKLDEFLQSPPEGPWIFNPTRLQKCWAPRKFVFDLAVSARLCLSCCRHFLGFILYGQYRPELVDFLKSWLMFYWWRSSFFFNVHPWKANDAETPHELAHKSWLNEPLSRIEGTLWSSDQFSRNCHRFCGVSDRSVQTFYSRKRAFEKGDCRVTCRDSLCGDLLFETTNSWKTKGKRLFRTGESTGLLARVEKCIPWKFVNLLSQSRWLVPKS